MLEKERNHINSQEIMTITFVKPNHNSHRNYAQLPNMQTKKLPLQIEVSGIKLVSKIWTNI